MGTLVVRAPNNAHESELVLHNVLHAPSIGYTLVSLGALDEEGYTSHIAGGRLRITSPHGEQIADIARTCHLYRVEHSPEFAHVTELMLSMELHVAEAAAGQSSRPGPPDQERTARAPSARCVRC